MAEQASALDSSSGVSVRQSAGSSGGLETLMSVSKTLNYDCIYLWIMCNAQKRTESHLLFREGVSPDFSHKGY